MTYFISGHRDLSLEDFKKYYIPKIREILEEDSYAEFVVGDCDGADKYAMDYIYNTTKKYITIYHMFNSPRNIPKMYEPAHDILFRQLSFRSGFKSDEERDSAMTRDSNFDIAFVFNNRWNSGTAQNIKRRHDA
jgi:hypothetical protein